jgi:beta-hydroxylase
MAVALPKEASRSNALSFAKRFRPALNRWFVKQSLVPNTPTLEPACLSWTAELRSNWHAIQAECDALLEERDAIPPLSVISPYHRRVAPDDRWRTFFFEAHGYQAQDNRARCPRTAALLDRVPDLVTAFYSVMDPGTHVPRHKGITKALLNVHLGLRIPAGVERCRIRIARENHGWQEGEFLVIDDTFKHEVWNDSDRPRALLFIQVLRPMTGPGRLLGKAIVRAVALTKYIRQARKALNATRK